MKIICQTELVTFAYASTTIEWKLSQHFREEIAYYACSITSTRMRWKTGRGSRQFSARFMNRNRVEYVKGGAAPLFLMGQVFEVFFEVFSLFCRIILDYVRTQIRARF